MSHSLEKSDFKELALFFKRWAANPLQLGAIFPSSLSLSRAIAKEVMQNFRLEDGEYILELGAGTGRFTKALIEAGIPEERLICIEIDQTLVDYLVKKFPTAKIIMGNACYLDSIIASEIHKKISTVVSGIPMMNIPAIIQRSIIEGCFKVLKSAGQIVQFTYSPFSSIKVQPLNLHKRRVKTVLKNFPPATVWAYTRA